MLNSIFSYKILLGLISNGNKPLQKIKKINERPSFIPSTKTNY